MITMLKPETYNLAPYIALTRLDKPVGIYLLLWPCLWSLALASGGLPPLELMLYFTLGAIIMRSAGCVINDIADRKFDGHVERTQSRPLASGALSVTQALLVLAMLLLIALVIVLQLHPLCLYLALGTLPLVAAYPFMKRITWWPQAFLGITFNAGALFGWAAAAGTIELPALLLYLGGIFWTLGYDTIYAHQDKADDVLIGVKSTALKLGKHNRLAITGFYVFAVIAWAGAGFIHDASLYYYVALVLTLTHLLWQSLTAQFDQGAHCHTRFISNRWMGAILFIGCVFA